MNSELIISGQILDIVRGRIFPGTLHIENGRIIDIIEEPTDNTQVIMPGFVDSHIHIESSMLVPSEFARIAVCHGTVATVSDPHEIANVLGIEGVDFMVSNGNKVPFKFFFGAPSCVPATTFETSGHNITANDISALMSRDEIKYMGEMMNFPGVINHDKEVISKLQAAKDAGKPIDGHIPGVTGEHLTTYVNEGISTDHECFSIQEALEKIRLGMKILIREGSAARNFDDLVEFVNTNPDVVMFCSDDKHPDDLLRGHINTLAKRAIAKGCNIMNVLKACSLNAIRHYNLEVGLLQKGDDADFVITDGIETLNIKKTYIKGVLMAENGKPTFDAPQSDTPNNFKASHIAIEDLRLVACGKNIKVIEVVEGELITKKHITPARIEEGNIVSDTTNDILKMAVLNRYDKDAKPAIGFIKNIGLKYGAIASSIAHDSHNIVAVGVTDEDLTRAINLIIDNKGGVVAYNKEEQVVLPMPVAGLMSTEKGEIVAKEYEKADALAKKMGATLHAPFMTLSFMSLLVIPSLKLSDRGLFDGENFCFTSVFEE